MDIALVSVEADELVNHKTDRLAALVQQWRAEGGDPYYLGFFECFNQQRFFEAHEVLEALWLNRRGGPTDLFYKGLIQLAGAFVHVQKNRPRPAAALFQLARENLFNYLPEYERLDIQVLLDRIDGWLQLLQTGRQAELLPPNLPVTIELLPQ